MTYNEASDRQQMMCTPAWGLWLAHLKDRHKRIEGQLDRAAPAEELALLGEWRGSKRLLDEIQIQENEARRVVEKYQNKDENHDE